MAFQPIKPTNSRRTLAPLTEAVLHLFTRHEVLSLENITSKFRGKDYNKIVRSVKQLERMGYIRLDEFVDVALVTTDSANATSSKRYQLLAPGRLHLNSSKSSTVIRDSYNTHSNIAHNSPHAQQTINIGSLDEEAQRLVKELEQAVKVKDGDKVKRTIGYILDKGVDVGLAVITQVLMKSHGLG